MSSIQTVPLGVDVGIAVFTALDLLLARLGMRMSWLRLVPWALVAIHMLLACLVWVATLKTHLSLRTRG